MKEPVYYLLLFFTATLFSCTVSNRANYSPQKKYSPQQLQKDLQVMEETLKNNHPSLYWYSTPQQVQASFSRAYTLVKDSMNETSFKNLLNETVFVLRCGHTSVRHSKAYNQYQAGRRPSGFPLNLKVLSDSSLAVIGNLNRRDSQIKVGMEIKSVNGLSARKLIDTLCQLVPIDGNAFNFSYQNLSNNFINFFNSRFQNEKNYRVRYVDFKGIEQEIVLPFYDPLKDSSARRFGGISGPPGNLTNPELSERKLKQLAIRSFTIDSSRKYAVLRLSSFTRLLRPSFIKQSFRQLRKQKIPFLIIDVRNNGGGLIKSSLLLTRHIKQQPFVFTDSIYSTHKKIKSRAKIEKKLLNNLGMWLLNRKVNDSLYMFRFFSKKKFKPVKHFYNGNVFVLTGGFSFSATTMFLSNIKEQQNVKLIGEETGGGYYGNNGVFIPDLVLPNTRLRVRLPMYRIVNKKEFPKNGSGVLPNIEMKASAESIRMNRDPKMEKAMELIKKQNR